MFHPGIVALLVWLAGVGVLRGAEPPAAVLSLGQGRFQIGLVTLDKSNRTVRFPARVHLREETVEYIIVHKTGKAHESVLTTEAQPQDIHLALLLLGLRAAETNRFGADGQATPPGERVAITASWTNAAALTNCPIEDLVLDKETGQPPARGSWTFNGSNFSEGMFTAQRDGSILSLHIDPDALLNNPRPGRANDDLHRPHAALLPATGAAVTVTIQALPRRRSATPPAPPATASAARAIPPAAPAAAPAAAATRLAVKGTPLAVKGTPFVAKGVTEIAAGTAAAAAGVAVNPAVAAGWAGVIFPGRKAQVF